MSTPKLLDTPDMAAVIQQAKDHIERMGEGEPGEHVDNDDSHYIFEAVIEACYGSGVWEWYRGRQG